MTIMTLENATKAMEMREAGFAYEQIATELGISIPTARHLASEGSRARNAAVQPILPLWARLRGALWSGRANSQQPR
jgi:orotate phosphoribosyltransferase-like protein